MKRWFIIDAVIELGIRDDVMTTVKIYEKCARCTFTAQVLEGELKHLLLYYEAQNKLCNWRVNCHYDEYREIISCRVIYQDSLSIYYEEINITL